MGRAVKVGVVAAVSFAVACTSILGDLEVVPDGALTPDASTTDGSSQPPGDGGPSVEAGGDGGVVVRACALDSDCLKVTMTPAACAVAECRDSKCVYTAVDKDGDGHPLTGCIADGIALPGDDCADGEPTVFPGGSCTQTPDGTPILYPNNTPLGACKAGKWSCVAGKSVCAGAVAPQATDNCALHNDENCNGSVDDGCDCTPGATSSCGNTGNLPLPCTAGVRECLGGKWGECKGNTEPGPRNCSSPLDNDCNGAKDVGEAACNCAGNVPQGGTASCVVAGGLGVCASGSWTCQASSDAKSGVFGPCNGPKPANKDCKSVQDNDCNGLSDQIEIDCGSPCTDPLGSGSIVPGAQVFDEGMWGCAASRTFANRATGCAKGWRLCSMKEWGTYIRNGGKRPSHKYWTADQRGVSGSIGACFAPDINPVTLCKGSSMTVCPLAKGGGPVKDAEGNECAATGCSLGSSYTVNDYIGGCSSNDTGGTLCCPE